LVLSAKSGNRQSMTFADTVAQIRAEQGLGIEVPEFDPDNGNEQARYLFLLEAPGPKAIQSGYISLNNPDPTARNFRHQLSHTGIEAEDIALWNIVPWYLGDQQHKKIRKARTSDIEAGLKYIPAVVSAMPKLECIILVGAAARQAHVPLSALTQVRILSCHHPSAQCLNANPDAEKENISVFRFMQSC
jgi:uracil-DNA glycosylase